VQEKNRLIKEIRTLKDHYAKYEPALEALKRKYDGAMREKALVALERDRLREQLRERAAVAKGAAAPGGGGDDAERDDTIKGARPPRMCLRLLRHVRVNRFFFVHSVYVNRVAHCARGVQRGTRPRRARLTPRRASPNRPPPCRPRRAPTPSEASPSSRCRSPACGRSRA
jgi:hypothetical protein